MKTLTNKQSKFLLHLLDLQEKKIWNNARRRFLKRIVQNGFYSQKEAIELNELASDYLEYKKTGIITDLYKCDY